MCTRIGIFVAGRMVASGTVDDLAAEHGGRFVIEVEVAEDDADLDALIDGLPSVVRREREGSRWTLHAQQDIRRDLAHRLADADLTVIHLDQHGEDLGVIYRRYFAADDAAAQREEATPGSGRTP